ncbi:MULTISPECIES: dihydroorotase [unclassified Actinobaculum]|uniref:dihydroorotase n=1 Tax=unclassified Actinobaculum TaxID=2609299 RepID=UPI000D52A062|nr:MULTISPECIES: dihydroorotase [unclassified Actinobaculum]AWE42379.1 dihydroorotase [Actinobaculum sp. 313]RTE48365.1 dihydroorotase [Actinobaculum sp. 352]
MSRYLIRGARLLGKEVVDILTGDDTIEAVGADLPVPADAIIVHAAGLIALPGLVDPHTHLREPGREDSETVLTGSQAAAAGGYTCVNAMANTMPVQDTAGVVEQVLRLGREAGYVDVRPVGAVSAGLAGEHLAELGAMAESAAAVRYFSDDGACVADPVLMRRALEYAKSFGGVIAQHAQDPRLTEGAQMHEGEISAQLGLAGWPAVAEESIVARDCLLAQHVGSRVHILHLSTKGSVDLVRWAKSEGMPVTAEATPHHLALDHREACSYDPRFKVNPPLRTPADIEALRRGIVDGTIDVIGTDHAPHPAEDKDCEWSAGAHGMIGLETALSVVQQTLVDTGLITWSDVARLMSYTPAQLCQNPAQGRPIAVGEPANLCLHDPRATRMIRANAQHSKSANTPWEGRELPGRIMYTFYRGVPTVWDGQLRGREEIAAEREAW